MPSQSDHVYLSANKLLAWLDSQLSDTEGHIAGELKNGNPHQEFIRELEGRLWAYKLTQQYINIGAADATGETVCGACGSKEMLIMTGLIVCAECYQMRGSECSMTRASSVAGRAAI